MSREPSRPAVPAERPRIPRVPHPARVAAVALAGVLVASGLFLVPAASAQESPGVLRAGVAVVDATWHVGASAGQYATGLEDGVLPGSQGFDPHLHQVRRVPSYGIQSRLSARALVVEGPDGTRVALVKNDLYIPQDMLWRRTAQILEANGTSGIDREHLTMMVSHNHSSPYYSSTTWGPWAFQDGFDLRFFEYYAQRQARAVELAAERLVPARMGASVSYFDKTHRHSYGPAIADDGTPAGYPVEDNDHDMMVVRFDDVSDPSAPRPLAILANFGLHPEFLNGNDLVSADYIGPLERMVDRETGAVLLWSQGSVGTAEPERSTYHSIHERLEFTHREYAQAEYGARLMADSVIDTWRDIARRTPEEPDRFVALSSRFPVSMVDHWYPGPNSHPYPGVSSCRTDQAFQGNPRLPIVGLPDCQGPADFFGTPRVDAGVSTDTLQAAGIPVPENYSAPSYNSLQEDMGVHLQAIRLGPVLLAVCSCEQWADQTRNIKTRTDRVTGNMWIGYDWGARCTDAGDGTWTCPNPHNPSQPLPAGSVTDHEYRRMRAQVNNDAAGWNDLENVVWAESEPTDTTQIKGNYTHEELPRELGYGMTMTIGMALDYNGYIATYREYQRGDHYRKALTAYGAHASDYMATRLVEMGGFLNGGPPVSAEPLDPKEILDNAINDAKGELLEAAAQTAIPAYEALLPDDGGDPGVVQEPEDIQRFETAFLSWIGGSNYTDDPQVTVERLTAAGWEPWADMTGEVVVTLEFPEVGDVAPYLLSDQEWRWTAHFEAFSSYLENLGARVGNTRAGAYRFVVEGFHRSGGQPQPYRLESRTFRVDPWTGIRAEDLRVEPDGRGSFLPGPVTTHTVCPPERRSVGVEGPCSRAENQGKEVQATLTLDYPDSYESPARFIRHQRSVVVDPDRPNDPSLFEWYCFPCTFRPWADTGNLRLARVTILRADGSIDRVFAAEGEDGRWYTEATLQPGDRAFVPVSGLQDRYGNFNGQRSDIVTR